MLRSSSLAPGFTGAAFGRSVGRLGRVARQRGAHDVEAEARLPVGASEAVEDHPHPGTAAKRRFGTGGGDVLELLARARPDPGDHDPQDVGLPKRVIRTSRLR